MRKIIISTLILTGLLLGGCVYVADVQQGNVIDKKELDQLKPGMTKKTGQIPAGLTDYPGCLSPGPMGLCLHF